jgi:hypothetical protein
VQAPETDVSVSAVHERISENIVSIRSAIEQLAGPIGEELGASDDFAQATMLNKFCEMLERSCRGEMQTQICFFTRNLTPQAKRTLRLIAEFCEEPRDNR